jgi:hypothetical protein
MYQCTLLIVTFTLGHSFIHRMDFGLPFRGFLITHIQTHGRTLDECNLGYYMYQYSCNSFSSFPRVFYFKDFEMKLLLICSYLNKPLSLFLNWIHCIIFEMQITESRKTHPRYRLQVFELNV